MKVIYEFNSMVEAVILNTLFFQQLCSLNFVLTHNLPRVYLIVTHLFLDRACCCVYFYCLSGEIPTARV